MTMFVFAAAWSGRVYAAETPWAAAPSATRSSDANASGTPDLDARDGVLIGGLATFGCHRMATAHLPTTANDGVRTHGLTAERGHAESVKQIAPSPLASEITAGTTMSSTRSAPRVAATAAPRGFAFVMVSSRHP